MSNMLDYLDWRGDITIHQSGINDVDCLIMSQISYMNFSEVVDAKPAASFGEAEITIKEASKRLFEIREQANEGLLLSDNDTNLLKELAKSRRFCNMKLAAYVDRCDEEEEKQFAAICIFPGDSTVYVSFRGTDDTLVGWKEDLNMSFLSPVPSQTEALEYLNVIAKEFDGKIRIGGHSKGGNLAVYAASFCDSEIQKRIRSVYCFDGPGFVNRVLDDSGFGKVEARIHAFVPQSSVVGMLLGHPVNYTVVESVQTGLYQHDPYSWQVKRNNFICLEIVSAKSRFMDITLEEWIYSMNSEQRKEFVEAVYAIVQQTEAKTLLELSVNGLKNAKLILRTMKGMDTSTKKMLQATFSALMRIAGRNLKYGRKPEERVKNEAVT